MSPKLLVEGFLSESIDTIKSATIKKFLQTKLLKSNKMIIKDIKAEFPIFKQKIKGKPLVYLDSANSSQKPKVVIDEISKFYETEFSNVGRSVHTLAVKATNKFEETRDTVKNYINAKHREEIIFTKGATEAINLVATVFGEAFIKSGDEILLTELEHHSNYVPWHYLKKKELSLNLLL